jgi:hypothetical protein
MGARYQYLRNVVDSPCETNQPRGDQTVSNDFIDRLLTKLDEEFASGTQPVDIDAVANAVARADEEKEDVSSLLAGLRTTGLLSFDWGFPSSPMSLDLLRTADDHGYVMTYPTEEGWPPTTGWARVTDCNSSAAVSAAVKRALLEDGFPVGGVPLSIAGGGLVDRTIVAEAIMELCDGDRGFGFTWAGLADGGALPTDLEARVKAGTDSGGEQLSQILTVAEKEHLVEAFMEKAYTG